MLEPILYFYKNRRRPGEALGDFTSRVGFDAIRQYSKVHARPLDPANTRKSSGKRGRHIQIYHADACSLQDINEACLPEFERVA